ncbi:MAG: deoxyribodipyrimidine photo-lyase, partial [Arenibacterium sp.]
MQVVWFKRDLRSVDHRPLVEAAARGPVLPLYVVEPDLWREPDMAARHWSFIAECLKELQRDLAELGQPLIIRFGEMRDVLDGIATTVGISRLWSHEETGNGWTFQRDKAVAAWCRENGIEWREIPNHGVQRRLASRNGWAKAWDRQMAEPIAHAPRLKPVRLETGTLPNARDLKLKPDLCPERQMGGRKEARALLESFLNRRGETYRRAMSSPLTGATACSRLSPHLAWGTLSMREVAQATWSRQQTLSRTVTHKQWRGALHSFSGRLHWHCHFMQKLEDAPEIEVRNLHRAYDGLRPATPDQVRLQAWAQGETGLPFVDACMRA